MIDLKKFEQLTDQDVVSRILTGEAGLYEIIIRRYNPYLFKIGRSYGFNQQDTEDLMQETFISAYRNLGKFQHRASVKTWLVRIMLNFCYHKKHRHSFKYESPSDVLERTNGTPIFPQNHSNPGKTLMNQELKHILEEAIVQIPEEYRMVFTLRELNGMSTRETSEALKITESNVKVRLKRAKGLLRREIQKHYSPEEIFEFNLIYCNRIVFYVFQRLGKEPYQEKKEGIFRIPAGLKKYFFPFQWRNYIPW